MAAAAVVAGDNAPSSPPRRRARIGRRQSHQSSSESVMDNMDNARRQLIGDLIRALASAILAALTNT